MRSYFTIFSTKSACVDTQSQRKKFGLSICLMNHHISPIAYHISHCTDVQRMSVKIHNEHFVYGKTIDNEGCGNSYLTHLVIQLHIQLVLPSFCTFIQFLSHSLWVSEECCRTDFSARLLLNDAMKLASYSFDVRS